MKLLHRHSQEDSHSLSKSKRRPLVRQGIEYPADVSQINSGLSSYLIPVDLGYGESLHVTRITKSRALVNPHRSQTIRTRQAHLSVKE